MSEFGCLLHSRWILAGLISLILLGCAVEPASSGNARGSNGPSSEESLFFPRQAPASGERVVMEALIVGELVEEEGCLRIRHNTAWDYVVVWPPGFTASEEDGFVAVRDPTGRLAARTGVIVRMGGGVAGPGFIPWVDADMQTALKEHCPSPSGNYWVAGEGIEIVGQP